MHTLGMQVTAVDDKITKVTLNGRLDTLGVGQIETRFVATLVPGGKSAIVDLSGVEFVASLGIRMLISVARGLRQRQAKLAIYNVPPLVQATFDIVALSQIIPIGTDEDDARRLVSS
jgi:anti-sigma B factor antagonist